MPSIRVRVRAKPPPSSPQESLFDSPSESRLRPNEDRAPRQLTRFLTHYRPLILVLVELYVP